MIFFISLPSCLFVFSPFLPHLCRVSLGPFLSFSLFHCTPVANLSPNSSLVRHSFFVCWHVVHKFLMSITVFFFDQWQMFEYLGQLLIKITTSDDCSPNFSPLRIVRVPIVWKLISFYPLVANENKNIYKIEQLHNASKLVEESEMAKVRFGLVSMQKNWLLPTNIWGEP